jgi:hypothetical protein
MTSDGAPASGRHVNNGDFEIMFKDFGWQDGPWVLGLPQGVQVNVLAGTQRIGGACTH